MEEDVRFDCEVQYAYLEGHSEGAVAAAAAAVVVLVVFVDVFVAAVKLSDMQYSHALTLGMPMRLLISSMIWRENTAFMF